MRNRSFNGRTLCRYGLTGMEIAAAVAAAILSGKFLVAVGLLFLMVFLPIGAKSIDKEDYILSLRSTNLIFVWCILFAGNWVFLSAFTAIVAAEGAKAFLQI